MSQTVFSSLEKRRYIRLVFLFPLSSFHRAPEQDMWLGEGSMLLLGRRLRLRFRIPGREVWLGRRSDIWNYNWGLRE